MPQIVCLAAAPALNPTLYPSGRSSASSRRLASSTSARMSARSWLVASHQVAIKRRGTTKTCPGLTGKRSAITNAD
jgi:hypothetical protein